MMLCSVLFVMIRRPPCTTITITLVPYATVFRSSRCRGVPRQPGVQQREIQVELRHLQQGTAEHFTDYFLNDPHGPPIAQQRGERTEEHTSELQSLMRTSYAGICSQKRN